MGKLTAVGVKALVKPGWHGDDLHLDVQANSKRVGAPLLAG